jgi:hypothetical protein
MVPESSDQGAGEEKGSMGVPILGSPGLGRRWSGCAMTVNVAVEERSMQARSGHVERGRRGGGGADVGAPFFRVRGGVRRPSIGEERAVAVAVVRHNGDEGDLFRRGSVRE